jgi:hypothetical protein
LGPKIAGFEAQLTGPARLLKVVYQDRYIQSPLNARLLVEVLRVLKARAGTSWDQKTRTILRTTGKKSLQGNQYQCHHDWVKEQQEPILKHLLAAFGPFDLVYPPSMEHARRLILVWDDGKNMKIALDQGLSFVQLHPSSAFPFERDVPGQASAVLAISGKLSHAQTGATLFYAEGVTQGTDPT